MENVEKKELTENEKYRYNRQIKLLEVGIEGQIKLKKLKIKESNLLQWKVN